MCPWGLKWYWYSIAYQKTLCRPLVTLDYFVGVPTPLIFSFLWKNIDKQIKSTNPPVFKRYNFHFQTLSTNKPHEDKRSTVLLNSDLPVLSCLNQDTQFLAKLALLQSAGLKKWLVRALVSPSRVTQSSSSADRSADAASEAVSWTSEVVVAAKVDCSTGWKTWVTVQQQEHPNRRVWRGKTNNKKLLLETDTCCFLQGCCTLSAWDEQLPS